MIQFLPLAGANDSGINCFYLNIDGIGVILDSGVHPRKVGSESLPDFSKLEDKPIDYVFISHAHQDHIGSLPYLINKFPYLKIYMTPQTREISSLTLHSTVAILKEEIEETDLVQHYTHDEIDLLMRSVNESKYNEPFELTTLQNNKSITVEFFDAGHILGSAGILIEYQNKKIYYSGDTKLNSQYLLSGAKLPEKPVDVLLLESTYGSTDTKEIGTREEREKRFTDKANEVIGKGGSILIPVFSLGKTQELLKLVHDKMKSGKLTEVPIYTGGLGEKISRLYDSNRYLVNMIDPNFKITEIPREKLYEVSSFDLFRRKPSIVFASSGMILKKTASFVLAKYWFRQKDFAIFTVGYMDPDTPGYKISKSKKGDDLTLGNDDEVFNIKCEIENFRFTAHSHREELLDIAEKLKPGRIILFHGDDESVNWLGGNLLDRFKGVKVHTAENFKSIIF
ncbi:MAG: MBL fold metallo-hydrolase [Melioribacteraceae bacterium]|nr:MBL fold metallo-hydrolase [Melioribacteraceae bacterium]